MALALGKIDGRTSWRQRRFLAAPLPKPQLTNNGPTLTRPYFYLFDGGDYFTSPNTSDYDVTTGNYTWVIAARFASVNTNQNILGKRKESGGTDGYAWAIVTDGTMILSHQNAVTTGYSTRNSAASLSADTDYCVAISREGTTLHLYINGAASEGTQTNSGTVTTLSTSVAFEVSNQLISAYAKLADGSRIYGMAFFATNLTAAQIAAVGNAIKARSRFAWD